MTVAYELYVSLFLAIIAGVAAVTKEVASKCPQGSVVTFLRVSRTRFTATPIVESNSSDDVTCAQYCANNIEPVTGAPMSCQSFNFDGNEQCQFFGGELGQGDDYLTKIPGLSSFYFQKVCLPGVTSHNACTFRSYSFERIRNMRLIGFVRKSLKTESVSACLSACLTETGFVCRSSNFFYASSACELSDQDRRSRPHFMESPSTTNGLDSVDYFDNNCLNRQNRCGQAAGNLVFVRTADFELHFFDHGSTQEASESQCLQRCLESATTFCRSVEFAATNSPGGTTNCVISDEDTFSRADGQGSPADGDRKDYYEPVCISTDLSSATCRQQAAFTRLVGQKIVGTEIASQEGVSIADCLSLCFQHLDCGSVVFDRSAQRCQVFSTSRSNAQLEADPSSDYYEFHCDSQFGGIAMCTPDGIKFTVNTREPYTGAVYAAENFGSCNETVTNAKQITMLFPPPTVTSACGSTLKNGKLSATVVVSLDGVLPHQVTTEWDRFYRVTCDTTLKGTGEGSVVVTTMFDTEDIEWQNKSLMDSVIDPDETGEEANETTAFARAAQPKIFMPEAQVLPAATPGPASASLAFVDSFNNPVAQAYIGDDVFMVLSSPQAAPNNMMVMDCIATQGHTQSPAVAPIPFKVIENGCPTYPALVGPITQDIPQNRLTSKVKAFRLDGSYYVQITCTVMFCAGAHGCPPSYGRKRRSSGTGDVNSTGSEFKANLEETSQEELSAFIRVLAEGEAIPEKITAEEFKAASFAERGQNLVDLEPIYPDDMLCMGESSFIGVVVTMSLLCIAFSSVIVAWGCNILNSAASNSGKDPVSTDSETNVSLTSKASATISLENTNADVRRGKRASHC